MSATDSSSFELAFRPAPGDISNSSPVIPAGEPPGAPSFQSARTRFWLNGEVLACACPDCGSPMSIRLWLMLADCWVCGTSIELTEEEERQARNLLLQHTQSVELPAQSLAPKAAEPPPATAFRSAPAPKPVAPSPAPPSPPRIAPPPLPGTPKRCLAADKPSPIRRRLTEIAREGPIALWFRESFRYLYAWIASAIIHMALLILLAFVFSTLSPEPDRPLVLSVRVNSMDEDGGYKEEEQLDPIMFDDPGKLDPAPVSVPTPPGPDGLFDEPLELGKVPGLEPADVPSPPGIELPAGGDAPFFGRSPEARNRVALQEGGTIESEAAVNRGLEWLARHQNPDGSWSLHAFDRAGECNGRCRSPGCVSDTAGTALALLPFLGAGQTHMTGLYKTEVRKGLYYLVKVQDRNGSLIGAGDGRMYAHGQAAIALCEAYALTRDEKLRGAAQLALDFIIKAQHAQGGWRYHPGQPGDTSVVGWQIMALRSGQMAYLKVPDKAIEQAKRFLHSVQCDSSGGTYAYMPGFGASHVMTAEALLCRQYLGWQRNHPGLQSGCQWLLKEHLPRQDSPDIYYWYYATQVMHHMGGTYFEKWNARMRDLLVRMQRTKGHEAGSWDPVGGHSHTGGRLYQTALSICTLEVYYRHMPLYRTTAAEK